MSDRLTTQTQTRGSGPEYAAWLETQTRNALTSAFRPTTIAKYQKDIEDLMNFYDRIEYSGDPWDPLHVAMYLTERRTIHGHKHSTLTSALNLGLGLGLPLGFPSFFANVCPGHGLEESLN